MEVRKTFCPKCLSNNKETFSEASGWAFFEECKDCGHKSFWSINDAIGCEGCDPYHLISHSDDWMPEFHVNRIHLILKEAEEGYDNKNGKIYDKYDRLNHTAKNLIVKGYTL